MRRRVVLDECLPTQLTRELTTFEVQSAQRAGLAGMKNGKLLEAIAGRFDVFITIDGNLAYQQDLRDRLFGVVVLHAKSNRMPDLLPLLAELNAVIASITPGEVKEITFK
jgi:hypothetical protein